MKKIRNIRVLILSEAGNKIGFGHFTRCLSLMYAFRERGVNPEFIVHGDETILDLSKDVKFQRTNWLMKNDLDPLLEENHIVVIDSYLAPKSIYELISKRVRLCVYIDDNHRLNYPPGLVINGTVSAAKLIEYPKNKEIIYRLGAEYIPLRPEFWTARPKKINREIKSILILFGGDDLRNMMPRVLSTLAENYPQVLKRVVIGKGFRNIEQIENMKDANTELNFYPDAQKMKDLMLKSDIAISSSGQSLYELARMGVPAVAIAVAENQMNNIRGWSKVGFIQYAGWWEDKKLFPNIVRNVKKLQKEKTREKISRIGQKYVDGQGALRVVDTVLKHWNQKTLYLRLANSKDVELLFRWANDPVTRKNSLATDIITWKTHQEWFRAKLKNASSRILIAENSDAKPVGVIRFERQDQEAILSYSVDNRFREQGIGTLLVETGLREISGIWKDIDRCSGVIKVQNIASKRIFEKAGFKILKNGPTVKYGKSFK